MIFTKASQYAIRALCHLARQPPGDLCSIREIGQALGIPLPFLAKIVSSLSRSGLVSAQRGPGGGVTLARPPADITVGEIVAALEGGPREPACILGFADCDEENPCPLHQEWEVVQGELDRRLLSRRLSELA